MCGAITSLRARAQEARPHRDPKRASGGWGNAASPHHVQVVVTDHGARCKAVPGPLGREARVRALVRRGGSRPAGPAEECPAESRDLQLQESEQKEKHGWGRGVAGEHEQQG